MVLCTLILVKLNIQIYLKGRSVRTKLVKDNKVVKYLFDNPKYDFNYQFNNDIEPIKLNKVRHTNQNFFLNKK